MSSFTTPLIVTPLDNNRWKLRYPFVYYISSKEIASEKIKVPAGFVTDFASVPRIFWSWLPPWGKYGKAAVIHDFLYFKKIYSRKRSDRIFYDAMKVLKVQKTKRWIIWKAVRLFGAKAWHNERLK